MLGLQHGRAVADDVVKYIFGFVAPVIELAAELVLALLLFSKPLEDDEAAHGFPLPVGGGGGEIDINPVQLDQFGELLAQVLPLQALIELQAGGHERTAHCASPAQVEHLLRHRIDGKDLPFHIHPQNPHGQGSHEDIQVVFRPQAVAPQGHQAVALVLQGGHMPPVEVTF